MTDLEPSVDSVGRQACPLGTDLPFGEDLEVESVCVAEVDGSSPYLLSCFLVTAQEVVDSGTLIGDTEDCRDHQYAQQAQQETGWCSLDNVV